MTLKVKDADTELSSPEVFVQLHFRERTQGLPGVTARLQEGLQ